MAPVFGSFFSPGCSAGYIGSLSLALAIQGCLGRELYFSSTAKALTTADYASCCHLYIQQYVISFLSSSHLSQPASSFCFSRLLALSVLSFCLCHLWLSSVSLCCLHSSVCLSICLHDFSLCHLFSYFISLQHSLTFS